MEAGVVNFIHRVAISRRLAMLPRPGSPSANGTSYQERLGYAHCRQNKRGQRRSDGNGNHRDLERVTL